MSINKIIIKNFKSIKDLEIDLNEHLNIIVGPNEAGKSTILEAIHLAIEGQINGRSILNEINPYLFNTNTTKAYFTNTNTRPPNILIEIFFNNNNDLIHMQGECNSKKTDCPGVSLSIELNENYQDQFEAFIKSKGPHKIIPTEYYKTIWKTFKGDIVTPRRISIRSSFIDSSLFKSNANTYNNILNLLTLDDKERVDLAIAYRSIKDTFLEQESIKNIHDRLSSKEFTDKQFALSIDISSRSTWESALIPHFNDIPFTWVGKGEQNTVGIKLAINSAHLHNIFLIEEPENHLTYANMHKLIGDIEKKVKDKQIIVTTHSSFVLNKLGVQNTILLNKETDTKKAIRLINLTKETYEFFMKLPGHNTLRIILPEKAILVEGPSDELVIHRAYIDKYGHEPLEKGWDIVTTGALSFLRYLEIAKLLGLNIVVVTDNDGKIQELENKYRNYLEEKNIKICYCKDASLKTLEPAITESNDLETLVEILGKSSKSYSNKDKLTDYMKNNKTESALSIFSHQKKIKYPQYINDAIS